MVDIDRELVSPVIALLIPGTWLLLSCMFLCSRKTARRESMLKAALVVMLVIVASTEVLSRFDAIGFFPLCILWSGVFAVASGVFLYLLRRRCGLQRLRRKLDLLRRQPPRTARSVVFAALTSIVLVLTLFSVSRQYPYDNDSICYHMPRVANWINQGNVEFFPTVNQRQNFYAPGAAYVMLHVQVLSGTDKYAILPQYAGMLLCLMLVSMLASQLGLGRTGQWSAVVMAATIPILIGQSHCNQNELVVGALLLGFAWLLIQFAERPGWLRAIWCGCALGLALVTKGTALFYGAAIGLPLGGLALARAVKQPCASWTRTLLQLSVAALLALSFMGPMILRCAGDGKTYLDNEFTSELRNTRLGWDILKANTLRNAAVHVGLPDDAWNKRVETWVHDAIGEQAANEESTFRSLPFKMHPKISCFYSTNPLHLALVLVAWLLVPLMRRVPRDVVAAYIVASLLGALFFNLCLKWQYWGIRLQLPWLLLSIPLCSVVLFRIRLPQVIRNVLQVVVVVALFIGALPALLVDDDLPLWQARRAPLMFRDAESVRFGAPEADFEGRSDFSRVAAFLRPFDPDEVGLIVPRGNSCSDYNWWVVFGTNAKPGRPRIRHVAPDAWPRSTSAPPEWVIVRGRTFKPADITGTRYRRAFHAGSCRLYRRVTETPHTTEDVTGSLDAPPR